MPDVPVGATRWSAVAGLGPDDVIPVEWSATTDADGRYIIDVDGALPGLDRVAVFTAYHIVFNELHGGADTRGLVPRRRDLDEPGVLPVDLAAGAATNVDFQVASSKSTERVLMRDGVTTLATDVWLPSRRPGLRWPVVLSRTPYARGYPSWVYIAFDYAVVIQSTRGREDSDGVDQVFEDDGWDVHQDGYDAVEWAAAQAWSNGRVGMAGGSALGITQYRAAGAAPPHLLCAIPEVATANPYHDMFFPGGVWRKNLVETWVAGQGSQHKLADWYAHPNEDDYWSGQNTLLRAGSVQVPMLHIGGWYDIFSQGTLDAFRVFHEQGGPGARRNQKLVIGPWLHGWYQATTQGQLVYPANSVFADYGWLHLRWFDFWLKGQDNGVMDEPPVRAYVMGPALPGGPTGPGNFWRSGDSWPPAAAPTAYYLQPGGSLSLAPPPTNGGETTLTANPAAPVPTFGGNNLYSNEGLGPYDQRLVDQPPSVKVWQTPPLSAPVEATGPLSFVLYASSDRPDTDWVVKLEDVYPDGTAMLVTDMVLQARHRRGTDREDLLTPGQVYRFDVELWDTSITFPAGHHVRVALQSSNSPRFEINPQTGEPFKKHTRTEVAINRVKHSASAPSHLLLSVVDPAAAQGCRPVQVVTGLSVEKLSEGRIRLAWDRSADACHRRYRVYAGIEGPQWPWVVRRPIGETEGTELVTGDAGLFWQVVSEGTDGGNGPR
ncbi:MAG: CocE/NonD family hydrolase [Acidobacteria bacterium]|nr:CocE/NonD family hydrolase [Acidobacteriota bacterium]